MRFFLPPKSKKDLGAAKKLRNFLVVFCLLFVLAFPLRPAHAQLGGVVTDIGDTIANVSTYVWDKVSSAATTLWDKAGAIAYQRALSTALNKIAYDTANYIGSGGAGQKPLFVTQNWGDYLKQTGDAAAGQFIETFANNLNNPTTDEAKQNCATSLDSCYTNCSQLADQMMQANGSLDANQIASYNGCTANCSKSNTACYSNISNGQNTANAMKATPSFNICSPSSLAAKIQIGLGLVNENQPQAPDCTASQMIKNWKTDIKQKTWDMHQPGYLKNFVGIFNPSANDLGIYVQAKSDMSSKALVDTQNTQTGLIAKQGWLDVTNIAGSSLAAPGTAARATQEAQDVQVGNLGKISSDVFVDAANIFLNQLAMSAFNKLVQSLGAPNNAAINSALGPGSYNSDTSGNGATALEVQTSKLLKPNFSVQADYDILSALAVCQDPSNPGPDNCVIDSQFMQAITEKKTVAEALVGGYLHGDWQITADSSGSSYNSSYSLRNIAILVKYRILPASWEEAARLLIVDPAKPKKATLNDLVSCFDQNDQYNTFSQDFPADRGWCLGLVDPNWVLKAPLNYCKKEGVGAQILNTNLIPGVSGMSSSTLSITRADGYCADNQTCISENSDGTCEAYGYCNQEKRIWDFNTDSCQPVNNTCQAFTSPTGQSVAYLKNTLDYSNCTSDNSGCEQYSLSGLYASGTGAVAWNSKQSLYFNKNLATCPNSDEGCSTLIRLDQATDSTSGINLVMDSDFSNDQVGNSSNNASQLNNWPVSGGTGVVVDTSQDPGNGSGKALKIMIGQGQGGVSSDSSSSLLPDNFQTIPGQAYTLSADIYVVGGVGVTMTIGETNAGPLIKTTAYSTWQHLSVTYPTNEVYNEPKFSIIGVGPSSGITFYIKNLKFEIGDSDTGYSAYGAANIIHEKLIPPYLASACYVNPYGGSMDYTLRSAAPSVCSNYARQCNQDEAGCDSYTNAADGFNVAARVTSQDYCPQDCLGYDVYISQGSYFSSPAKENLIPKTAAACSASVVGCTEFTNLDALASGGEQKEYYSQLKQCIKPDTAKCSNFYSWAGQGAGYQLQAASLEQDANGLPAVTSDDHTICNQTNYNLPVSDPNFNPDCQQYYNAAGQVAYHLASRTITCSDNCHAYRMTDKNVDLTLDQTACISTDPSKPDKHWDAAKGSCNSCLNGGIWDEATGACIYQAIPGEGQTCSASQNGCREYNGNNGSNVHIYASYDFESGLVGWTSSCNGAGVSQSTVASSNNGHSLQYTANTCSNMAAEVNVSGLINQGSGYVVKFLAQAAADTNLQINLVNTDTGAVASFNPIVVKGNGAWNIYQANLPAADQVVGTSTNQFLTISGNNSFFLDDVVLSEITDRYYLIKNSSQIPDDCYYDKPGNYQGGDYNLGCSQYTNHSGQTEYLRQFTKLCSDSAVGCEQMINTYNYSPSGPGFWESGTATSTCNSATDPNCVTVPGDSAIYAVYDTGKQCNSTSQGCSRLGQGLGGAHLTGWSDVLALNNPDNYNNILCDRGSLGCQAWTNADDGTTSYFKDPGFAACVYRASTNPGIVGKRWFMNPVKRCDLNGDGAIKNASGYAEQTGAICSSDSDCASGQKCLADNNDYDCLTTYGKTIGLGGTGNQVPTPQGNAGLCDTSASGCTEYVDPVTEFAPNLVVNSDYQTIDGNLEGWGIACPIKWGANNITDPTQQVVTLEPYKMYSAVATGASAASPTSLTFLSSVGQLANSNVFGTATTTFVIAGNNPIVFNALSNFSVLISGGALGKTISLKELSVSYQLSKNIDKGDCQGQTKFDNGCILFNERSVSDASGPAGLNYNAYGTTDGATPVSCDPVSGSCTANQLIKVRPDRVCGKWLDCLSYTLDPITKKKTCFSFGECDRLNDKGECANFLDAASSTATFDLNPKYDQNASGYALTNNYNFSSMVPVGRSLGTGFHFDFESNDNNSSTTNACLPGDKGLCLINGPDAAISMGGTDYPAHGTGYLKVGAYSPQTIASGISIKSVQGDKFFINYLLNTKGSQGASGQITVVDEFGTVIPLPALQASTGWTREVQSLDIGTGRKTLTLKLSATSTVQGGPVYFDDINIEPVLQTGDNQYAAPECRLYPSADSLTCQNINKNVISDGLEGYCLEHDPVNPNVCLLWYPMDSIPVSTPSVLGYNGNFPLDYCTAANGNFAFIEKRQAYYLRYESPSYITFQLTGGCPNYFDYSTNNECLHCGAGSKDGNGTQFCPDGYGLWISVKKGGGQTTNLNEMCVPDLSQLKIVTNSQATSEQTTNGGNWEECQPDMGTGANTFSEGYGIYDKSKECGGMTSSSNCANPGPNLKVYDYSTYGPISSNFPEAQLGVIPGNGLSSTGDSTYFHINCNKVVQTVDSSNTNNAWVLRTSNQLPYPGGQSPYTLTASYFSTSTRLQYTQSLLNTPFGAASTGRNVGSGVLPLNDIKLSTDSPYAGRPYGCINGSQNYNQNCSLIGACSGNPNIYCLATSTTGLNLSNITCGNGTYGTCQPLWDKSKIDNISSAGDTAYKDVLKNIFLSSKNALVANGTTYASDNTPGVTFDYTYTAGTAGAISTCTNNTRPDPSITPDPTFCAIVPKLSNLKLYFNDSATGTPVGTTALPYNITQKGIFRLQFNSQADAEQEPLSNISISWGDGYTQNITNQDNMPNIGAPHVYYHYYNKLGPKPIGVDIMDNWGFHCSSTAPVNNCFNPTAPVIKGIGE
jgi:hypothetical protein